MLFNSFEFLVFFPIVVAVYFFLPYGYRWMWLLAASCYFYMAFVPVYILILLFTIAIDWTAGIFIEDAVGARRKMYLVASIIANVGVLAVFKYLNFFASLFRPFAPGIAESLYFPYLLPIGLSFHTFQSLSYTIEVYRGHQKAERHPGYFALYVMFFPQLVAGPIERPQNLLHQLRGHHDFRYREVTDGLKLMTWGFFKKLVIADRLAAVVSVVFNHPQAHDGPMLLLATLMFSFQIYCDFSGYSDIAIGAAQVLGIKLMVNFRQPYFAVSITDFWRRWHISLSTWFRDYVYVPLGGNRVKPWRWHLNLLIVFVLSGFWHGANWTFLIWGALHGSFVILSNATESLRGRLTALSGLSRWPTLHVLLQRTSTFLLVSFAWIFFRANTLPDALYIVGHCYKGFRPDFLPSPELTRALSRAVPAYAAIAMLLMAEAFQRSGSLREKLAAQPLWIRHSAYYGLLLVIYFFGEYGSTQFIYFQF